ncbi:hypothetical protein E4O01_04780 [Treponema sp. OMZ 790]|nr:hypothetical protein [Treponema sp. OMZ 790]UTC68555.1 hypothetical protein E4O01_04780 [Treponema sp. OMZ 790]
MFLKSKIGLFKKSLFYVFLIMGSFAVGQNFDLTGFGYTDTVPCPILLNSKRKRD